MITAINSNQLLCALLVFPTFPQNKGAAGLTACTTTLSSIKTSLEESLKAALSNMSPKGLLLTTESAQQLMLLQQLLPQIRSLLDQHREQVDLEVRQQQLMSSWQAGGQGADGGSGGAGAGAGGAACSKCEATKPLLAFMQKVGVGGGGDWSTSCMRYGGQGLCWERGGGQGYPLMVNWGLG